MLKRKLNVDSNFLVRQNTVNFKEKKAVFIRKKDRTCCGCFKYSCEPSMFCEIFQSNYLDTDNLAHILVISSNSTGCLIWKTFMALVSYYSVFFYSFLASFRQEDHMEQEYRRINLWVIESFFFIDFFLNFITDYFD